MISGDFYCNLDIQVNRQLGNQAIGSLGIDQPNNLKTKQPNNPNYAKENISAQKKKKGKNPWFPKKDADYGWAKGPCEKKRQKKK